MNFAGGYNNTKKKEKNLFSGDEVKKYTSLMRIIFYIKLIFFLHDAHNEELFSAEPFSLILAKRKKMLKT